ncbi:hypothetical protein M5I08_01260 [Candidatus Mycobacterium methanotrophicum]|uniref:Transposase n=1 Tax=Candidatus Mycobacterium methanotrophicum TaxID=2943498 RepID=A0ABY4QKU8_9MYCO|nr:hypothetical protein [Candidatus Mycobacterium methanotrophicum]UQX11216.1 hypothetical protein M5I08_01260 [Candidatus Mycobacterium methanotrophicum]
MSLGLTPKQADLWRTTVDFCEGRVAPDSIYGVLHRIEGLSDREAVQRFAFDARWKYAAGGLVGRKRVLDSTPLYDAVATMDTVTLIRSAIRGLLAVAGAELQAGLRARLSRDDDYARAGKPVCDYDDAEAREELVDALARDAYALLACLDEQTLESGLDKAAKLLATVAGQDLGQDAGDGMFRIARRVAADRVISTADPDARHGHKTSARGFDGYKGHIAIDPDAEIITATKVTAGSAGDAEPATLQSHVGIGFLCGAGGGGCPL